MPTSRDSALLAQHIAFLKQTPLCAGLSEPDLVAFSRDLRLREYGKGQIIFQQGDPGHEVYLVVRGHVRVFRLAPSGIETTITILIPGEVLGEFAILDQQPRSAAACAIGPCALLQMGTDQFSNYLRAMPTLAFGLLQVLVAKARWTAAYAETIAQYDAAGRLLHILLLYNERLGEPQEAGKRYVLDLGLKQADLASLVGVRREWINHLLQNWSKRGLIQYAAGKIIILDLPRVIQERDSRIEANAHSQEW